VTTQGGNFPHFLMGHRRYLLGGNAKTIKPDKRKLVLSFDDPNIRFVFRAAILCRQSMIHNVDWKNCLTCCIHRCDVYITSKSKPRFELTVVLQVQTVGVDRLVSWIERRELFSLTDHTELVSVWFLKFFTRSNC
jgi:hypothetical protein